jgi:hypothetical protein
MKKVLGVLLVVLVAISLAAVSSQAAEMESSSSQPAVEQPAAAPAAVAEAPASGGLEVAEVAIAKGVENRDAKDVADTFTADVAKLYCWTKISGGQEGDTIVHRWKKGEEVMGEITLKVNGSPWRTFSSKTIMPEWKGKWVVEILAGDKVLTSKEFTIE